MLIRRRRQVGEVVPMVRVCKGCGKPFDHPGKAKFCADVGCRRERDRVRKRPQPGVVVDFKATAPGAEPALEDGLSVYNATLDALTSVNRLETPAGQAALRLAKRLDAATTDSGSSIAAVSKQHLATLSEALKGAPRAATQLDELRQRRAQRHGA